MEGGVFNRFRPCFNFGSPVFVLTFALLVYRLPTTTINLFTMALRLTAGELDLITHCLGKNHIAKYMETVRTVENRYGNYI